MLRSSTKDSSQLPSNFDDESLVLSSSQKQELGSNFSHFVSHISKDREARKLCILLMINILCTFLELIYGLISNSIGLISDAAHMLFDSTALAVGIYASYKATLPANKKFSYGYAGFLLFC